MVNLISQLFADVFKAWRGGSRQIRFLITAAFAFTTAAILVQFFGSIHLIYPDVAERLAGMLGVVAALIAFGVAAFQSSLDQVEREEKIEQAERRVQENPGETQAARELARVKLEKYVDRNLSQVRSIFWLTALVMVVGFGLIVYGVLKAYGSPANLGPSILSASAGALVNFIGASFLVIYRSTMSQAKDYVTILERLNAVGMAVQILEKIDAGEVMIKTQTTSDLAKQLLQLYTSVKAGQEQK